MRRTFTKKDLHSGDIIETRNGERGVVILEVDAIIYQAGGLDILDEVFTDDLFVDGTQREGDIFKVYHDPEGALGLNKLFGLDPVFVRRNDKHTRERAAELSDKHDWMKGRVSTIVLEPCFRRWEKIHVHPTRKMDIDYALSEAPSMTACGQIGIDRTYIPISHTENLFLLYNKYQEGNGIVSSKSGTPLFSIPEENITIYSRCLICRKDEAGQLVDLQEGDFEKVKAYLVEPISSREKN